MENEKKNRRTTTIEKFGENDFVVTWWDGSRNHYKTLYDTLNAVKGDFE